MPEATMPSDDGKASDSLDSLDSLSSASSSNSDHFDDDSDDDDFYYANYDRPGLDYESVVFDALVGRASTLLQVFDRRTSKIRSRLKENKQKLKRKLREQKVIRLRDKISFVGGITNIWFTTMVLCRFPEWMPLYFTSISIILITLRWFMYKSRKWHYFIADLCYHVNFLTMLYLHVFPSSKFIFIAAFCLAHGPVIWANYAWRTSLVLHSLDKVTSVWIHLSPQLTFYAIRWFTENRSRTGKSPIPYPLVAYFGGENPAAIDVSFTESMVIAISVYLLWQVLYFYFIMILNGDKVYSGDRATSFTWLVGDIVKKSPPNSPVMRLLRFCGPDNHVYVFMAGQLVFAVVTTAPAFLYYRYFWLHTAAIICIVMVTVFNGAGYYFEVFTSRYTAELQQINQDEQEEPLLEAAFGCTSSRSSSKAPWRDPKAEAGTSASAQATEASKE
ncbi:uncharacterized protein BJ171DRAFT_495372 [Polychytrium aggregatum]|uniref:uncharacterized protein n=1 Tax=Polychytrium aggregatum TaxID=110093 RepID=UPI0022FEEFB2|nr:uncharacterized protein BJ171DRAFT_495372 [Polychytrium aggregatum]KAI9206983.1 hypothetical protein BJ171DRAFT_495372 [Polychytrium aggregatum]